jgi:CRP-like cAMP-binding protein
MKTVESLLKNHPFFRAIAPDLLATITEGAVRVHYDEGQVIYRQGDLADTFLIVLDGRVTVEIFAAPRGSLIIHTAGPGDVVGWSWLFEPYRRRFDARAIESVNAVALGGPFLRQKAETDHRLGYELLKRVSQIVVERLQETRLQLIDVYGRHGS